MWLTMSMSDCADSIPSVAALAQAAPSQDDPSQDDLVRTILAERRQLETAYRERTPRSGALFDAAREGLPGGNTRSVLHADPYPVYAASAAGAEFVDVDGHRYIDFVGEFSAGLFGHDDPIIRAAIEAALRRGLVLAAPIAEEGRLASLITRRFPAIERLRFCNSGTEANLLALSLARAVTGRPGFIAFEHAYHGGVLTFSDRPTITNVPFDFRLARFNDLDSVAARLGEAAGQVAAIIVEPMLGAGGNIPARPGFLAGLRQLADAAGALLIFDEVKTSRLGRGGLQGREAFRPDLTTLGKYLGGGLPLAAFGGRADLLDRFDPADPAGLRHAGTFNNNICSMSAGVAALGSVYTADRAEAFTATGDALRERINAAFASRGLPVQLTGIGSIMSPHFTAASIASPDDISPASRALGLLLHRELELQGIRVCARGDIYLSLPMTPAHHDRLLAALLDFGERRRSLIERASS